MVLGGQRLLVQSALLFLSSSLASAAEAAEYSAVAEDPTASVFGDHGGGESHHAVTAVLFPWFSEIIGVVTFFVLARYCHFLPYTAVMFLIGLFMGVAVTKRDASNELAQSIVTWTNIDGHLLLLVFLPGLLFKDAFEVNFHLFKKSFWQLMTMAFPMVLAGTALVACVGYYVFPYDWSWALCMTFGSILAATDPVAVSVLLNEVGAPPRLKMHVSGESLLNDGSAVVFFTIFSSMFAFELGIEGVGKDITVGEGFAKFFQMSIGGALIGIAFGFALMLVLFWLNRRLNHEENIVQVAAAISTAYLSFYCAEVLAHCSGVIAVVFMGITTKAFGSNMINNRHLMESSVELVEWLLNTLLFVLAGAVFGHIVADDPGEDGIGWYAVDWGYLVLLWVLLNVIRFALTFSFYPVLSRIGLKSNISEATFLSFGGLRGAVGIALGLALEAEVIQATNIAGTGEEYQLWAMTLFGHVGGVSFLTLLINGSLAGPLLLKLGLAESSAIRKRVVEHFRIAAKENVIHTLIKLLADPRFDHVDMNVIFHHVPILKDLTLEEFKASAEKYQANTLPSLYKAPNLSNVLPYLLNSKKGHIDTRQGNNILVESFRASSDARTSSPGIDFDAMKSLYISSHPNASQSEYTGLLISAAAKGDLDGVKKLLATPSVDVNAGDYDKRTALHLASGEGHIDVIKLLIQHNADVNCEDRFGNRPLDDALQSKNTNAANLLRQYKALPGVSTESSDLITAAANGDVEEVRRLLDSDVVYDINAGDYDKRTALHLAAGEGQSEVVELLIKNGASITAKDRFGNTCLDDALRGNHKKTADVITRYSKRTQLGRSIPGKTRDLFGKEGRSIELRLIFIETLRQAYNDQVERGELDGRGVLDNILFGSLESAAVDAGNGLPLSDWEATNTSAWDIYVENTIRAAYSMNCKSGKAAFKTCQLQLDLRRVLAFIAAHTLAQGRFSLELCSSGSDMKEFKAAKEVILDESKEEVQKAKEYLDSHNNEDIAAVASHLCCLVLLNQNAKYMQKLAHAGLLKPKEANHFIEECDHEIINVKACVLSDHPGELSRDEKRHNMSQAGLDIPADVDEETPSSKEHQAQ